MLNYAGWRVVEKRGLEQEDISERKRSVQDGNTGHAGIILAGQFCGIKIAVLPPGHEGSDMIYENEQYHCLDLAPAAADVVPQLVLKRCNYF